MIRVLTLNPKRQELLPFTAQVADVVRDSGVREGLCTLFVRHTSCSLLIQENADPSARADLLRWLQRLVPEHDALYTHVEEGADDMPAHIKAALLPVQLSIPVQDGRLMLGSWQGIYLWEHRHHPGPRQVVVHVRTD